MTGIKKSREMLGNAERVAATLARSFVVPVRAAALSERKSGTRRTYRTIWISDVHLGTKGCNAELLIDFLDHTDSETMYLVGDIIDGWRLKRKFYWPAAGPGSGRARPQGHEVAGKLTLEPKRPNRGKDEFADVERVSQTVPTRGERFLIGHRATRGL